nr:helix-turn-helix domain-containing protein [Catenulispora pinistramenti]
MTRTEPAPEPETSQTLDRGIRVLSALADATAGLTVAQLAERVGAPRTAGYRLVATLEAHGLARRDPDGRVHLGVGVLRLAARVHPLLREAATPPLRRLAEEVGATAHLTVAEGPDALAIAVVEPTWTDYHVGYRVGSRHRLAQGAAGKAILLGRSVSGLVFSSGTNAGMNTGMNAGSRTDSNADSKAGQSAGSNADSKAGPNAGLNAGSKAGSGSGSTAGSGSGSTAGSGSGSTAGSKASHRDPASLYTVSEGELQAGAHGIAAPIRDVPGLEASVGVVSFAPLDSAKIAPRVIQAAAEISAALK